MPPFRFHKPPVAHAHKEFLFKQTASCLSVFKRKEKKQKQNKPAHVRMSASARIAAVRDSDSGFKFQPSRMLSC
jgi:hypothetical protein